MVGLILAAMIGMPARESVETKETKPPTFERCPYMEQFPCNKEIAKYLAIVVEDREKIRNILEAHGAWQDDEFGIWCGVPWSAEKWRLRWIENQRIHEAWNLLYYATWTCESEWASKERRQQSIDELIDEIGQDWFDRAIMPTPLSLRERIPSVVTQRFAKSP